MRSMLSGFLRCLAATAGSAMPNLLETKGVLGWYSANKIRFVNGACKTGKYIFLWCRQAKLMRGVKSSSPSLGDNSRRYFWRFYRFGGQ